MAQAIFLRAANVGGHNVFRPKDFAAEHPELALTNIGHAGTFVSRRDDAELRSGLIAALPVAVPVAVVGQAAVKALVAEFPGVRAGAKAEVTVHLEPPKAALPLDWSVGDEVVLLADHGWCVVTDRIPGGRIDLGKAIAAAVGVPGTTRSWSVMEKVAAQG